MVDITQNVDAEFLNTMNSAISSVLASTSSGENISLEQSHNQKILHNGYTFTFDKQSSDGSRNFWRCSKKHGCTARLHTDPSRNNLIIKEMNWHSHEQKRTRGNTSNLMLNGKFSKNFEELQNQSADKSGGSVSLDASSLLSDFYKSEDPPSMPKLEPQRKWTNSRKTRIFGDFQAGLLRKEPFETDPYFSRLVDHEGQRVAVICNYCCNIYSPQTGGQQAYHKRVCSHKVRPIVDEVENGDRLDLTGYDTSSQSPLPSSTMNTEQEMGDYTEVKHSMSFLNAMLDTADSAQQGQETKDERLQFNVAEEKEHDLGPVKRAKPTNMRMDLVNAAATSSSLLAKMVVSLKDVEGVPMLAKITPAQLTFADFRRIFLIPKNYTNKRFMFKCECEDGSAEYQWLLAMDDSMELPAFNGQIIAEARTCLV